MQSTLVTTLVTTLVITLVITLVTTLVITLVRGFTARGYPCSVLCIDIVKPRTYGETRLTRSPVQSESVSTSL